MQNLFAQLFPSSTILCSFSRSFQQCSVHCGTSSQTSKSKGLIRANYSFCIYYMPVYRITIRKHQYSASVCAKSVFPIVPKLDYIIQYFMIFPMMYRKLGHKLTNVKTVSINKGLIAFVHRITLRKHLYSPGLYAESFCAIVPKLDYIVQFFTLFPAMVSTLRHKLANVKIERINEG